MKEKQTVTSEQIYKSNRHKSKLFNRLSPVAYWFFLILGLIFFYMMIKNSIGNMIEIFSLLDSNVFNKEQITENYLMLVDRYGEWSIVGGNGSVVSIKFVDVRNALFSGLAITYGILTVTCLILSILLGKIIFKQLSKMYLESNEVMVDTATLRTLDTVEKKKKDKGGDWF